MVKNNQNNNNLYHALPIPGCALIGLGLGFLINQIVGLVILGLGIGLLITYYMLNKSNK